MYVQTQLDFILVVFILIIIQSTQFNIRSFPEITERSASSAPVEFGPFLEVLLTSSILHWIVIMVIMGELFKFRKLTYI